MGLASPVLKQKQAALQVFPLKLPNKLIVTLIIRLFDEGRLSVSLYLT